MGACRTRAAARSMGAYRGGLTLGLSGAIVGDNDTAIRFSAGAIDVDASFDFAGNAPFTIEV